MNALSDRGKSAAQRQMEMRGLKPRCVWGITEFTDEWYSAQDEAFVAAMRSEHPDRELLIPRNQTKPAEK